MSFFGCSVCIFLARYIAVVFIVSICLVCDSSIVATCPSIPAARFASLLCFIRFVLFDIRTMARVGRPQTGSNSLGISLLAVPRRLFCFGSLMILHVACCYLWLFSLYINIKIGNSSC